MPYIIGFSLMDVYFSYLESLCCFLDLRDDRDYKSMMLFEPIDQKRAFVKVVGFLLQADMSRQ